MIPLLFVLAAADVAQPSVCQQWGEALLLGAPERVGAAASSPCSVYLSASARLAETSTVAADPAGTGMTPLRDAARALDALLAAPKAEPLYDWARLLRLRIAWRLNEPPGGGEPALAMLAAASPDFVGAVEQQTLVAVLRALRDGQWPSLVAAPAGPARRLQLERLVELGARGRVFPAVGSAAADGSASLLELFVEYPDSKQAPLSFPAASLADLVRRAEVASDKHMNADVLKTVQAARTLSPDPAAACALEFFEGAALRKLRRYSEAEAALLSATKTCAAARQQAQVTVLASVKNYQKRAAYLLGQVQIIKAPLQTAAATLHRFAAEYAGDSLADDALFGVAVAQAKAGETAAAMATYEKVVALAGDQCAEAAFRVAYTHYREGRRAEARKKFAALLSGGCGSDDYERARAAYWLGRSHDDGAEAASAFARVRELAPLSYYDLLVRARTGQKAAKLPTASGGEVPRACALPGCLRARALSRDGLYVEAAAELEAVLPANDPAGAKAAVGDETKLAVAAELLEALQYYRASWLFRTSLKPLLGRGPEARTLPAWRIAYPRPFAAEIASAEKREGLPEDLLLALIREESAFQLNAGSWANAFGLTQLLVETAQMTARDAKLPATLTANDLTDNPALAIKLGAHHMAMLKRKYAHPALLLAGYNAGQGNVTKWMSARGQKPLDEFVEEIPFDETRGYVKRILKTWSIYRALAGQPAPTVALTLQ